MDLIPSENAAAYQKSFFSSRIRYPAAKPARKRPQATAALLRQKAAHKAGCKRRSVCNPHRDIACQNREHKAKRRIPDCLERQPAAGLNRKIGRIQAVAIQRNATAIRIPPPMTKRKHVRRRSSDHDRPSSLCWDFLSAVRHFHILTSPWQVLRPAKSSQAAPPACESRPQQAPARPFFHKTAHLHIFIRRNNNSLRRSVSLRRQHIFRTTPLPLVST